MSGFTKFWGDFSFTKKDLSFFVNNLGFLYKKYLKTYFIADFIAGIFFISIFSLVAVIHRVFLTDNILESEFYTIVISQFCGIVIFVFPLYFIFDSSYKMLNRLFNNADSTGFVRRDFIFTYKLAFSICLVFLRIFVLSFLILIMVFGVFVAFFPFVFSNANLVTIIVYCLLGIIFSFCFDVVCFYVVPEKFRILCAQLLTLVFITGGGLIFPVSSFSDTVSTLTQIIPSRALSDVLLYNFLGSRVPGGAVVTFFEFFFVFVCLFILVLSRCKNEKRVLFI